MTLNDKEKQLINQLNDLPNIPSKQSKEALYHKVEANLTANEEKSPRKWMIAFSTFATVIVVAFVFMLVRDQLPGSQGNQVANDMTMDNVKEQRMFESSPAETAESNVLSKDIEVQSEPSLYDIKDIQGIKGHHIIMPTDDVNIDRLITISAMDAYSMYPVPLTVINQTIEPIQFYNERLSQFQFNALGLTGETFSFGSFSEQEGNVTLTISDSTDMLTSSNQAYVVEKTLRHMFKRTTDKITIQNDAGDAVEIGPFGKINAFEFTEVNGLSYKYLETPVGNKFIVPIEATLNNETFVTIDEALADMQQPLPNFDIKSSIPKDVIYELSLLNKEVKLSFNEHPVLGDNSQTIEMIEAILMAAKSFNFERVTISIAGVETDNIGPYELNKPLPLPVAINPVFINE